MRSVAGRSRFASAADWPSWTDEIRFAPTETGPPSEADRRWAAANLNSGDGHTDEPTPLDVLELAAAESEARDRLERGLCL